jgi:hypothetical protein
VGEDFGRGAWDWDCHVGTGTVRFVELCLFTFPSSSPDLLLSSCGDGMMVVVVVVVISPSLLSMKLIYLQSPSK